LKLKNNNHNIPTFPTGPSPEVLEAMRVFEITCRPLVDQYGRFKVPDAITAKQGEELKTQILKLITSPTDRYDSYFPEVIVSYATGRRSNDAEGTGPGLFYAYYLIMQLLFRGVPCFSDLHIPKNKSPATFMQRFEVYS
jgi:hypothetical protein